jgi:hypothetical protein
MRSLEQIASLAAQVGNGHTTTMDGREYNRQRKSNEAIGNAS